MITQDMAAKLFLRRKSSSAGGDVTDNIVFNAPLANDFFVFGEEMTLSGNATFGTVDGKACVTFTRNSYAYLDGLSPEMFSGGFSMMGWHHSPAAYSASNHLVSIGYGASNNDVTGYMFLSTTRLRFRHHNTSGTDCDTAQTFARGVWHHVACTYDGVSRLRIYKNGRAISSFSTVLATPIYSKKVYLNAYNTTNSSYRWANSHHDIRIYSRELSANEIMRVMMATE